MEGEGTLILEQRTTRKRPTFGPNVFAAINGRKHAGRALYACGGSIPGLISDYVAPMLAEAGNERLTSAPWFLTWFGSW